MRRLTNILIVYHQILLLTLTQNASSQSQEPQVNYVGGNCQDETISSNSTYHTNILTLLTELNSLSSVTQFFTYSSGFGPDRVNGFYFCRPDLPLPTCNVCVNTTVNTIRQYCSNEKKAVVWYEECMVQYTNDSVSAANGNGTDPWVYYNSTFNVSEPELFPALMNNTMQRLILKAILPDNPQRFFATDKVNYTAFEEFNGMVLCRPDIAAEDCDSCLRTALSRIPLCCGGLRSWIMVMLPHCQLRYDTAPFIISPAPPSPSAVAPTSVPAPKAR